MNIMKKEYIEHIYAGWLAKIIGIRLGAPVEGWSQRQIEDIYGETDWDIWWITEILRQMMIAMAHCFFLEHWKIVGKVPK